MVTGNSGFPIRFTCIKFNVTCIFVQSINIGRSFLRAGLYPHKPRN